MRPLGVGGWGPPEVRVKTKASKYDTKRCNGLRSNAPVLYENNMID